MSSRKKMPCAGASADIDRRKSGADNVELVNAPPEEKEVLVPARCSCWKGNFRPPRLFRFLNVAIEAHTPNRVLRKVLEFSQEMPGVLNFELVPRSKVWTGIFGDYCPGKGDIGLYLFSENFERSEDYAVLVDFVKALDLALITRFKDVELLVFTSNNLSADSQKWCGKLFLWGLFRHDKTLAGSSCLATN